MTLTLLLFDSGVRLHSKEITEFEENGLNQVTELNSRKGQKVKFET